MATPWMTSDQLIAAVKRKISFPSEQSTFTDQEILDFANEEMMSTQVPSILQYHEDYFVFFEDVTLEENKLKYMIPNRAIGMKLQDVGYVDSQGTVHEMIRVDSGDKSYYNRTNTNVDRNYAAYYTEGNRIVLVNTNITNPTGSLRFFYYLRPNQLVPNSRALIISDFQESITIDNSSLVSGDSLTIGSTSFIAGTDFTIGATSILTASNLVTAINAASLSNVTASESSPTSATFTVDYEDRDLTFSSSNTSAIVLSSSFGIKFTTDVSSIYSSGLKVDFLQTEPGHRTYAINVIIPSSSILGS